MVASPTQRALKVLRDRGFIVHITEKWNAFAHIRQDAFGFGDLLAMKENEGITLVQVTSAAHHSTRKNKIIGIPDALTWLKCGGRILVMSFKKNKSLRYEIREEWLCAVDFNLT